MPCTDLLDPEEVGRGEELERDLARDLDGVGVEVLEHLCPPRAHTRAVPRSLSGAPCAGKTALGERWAPWEWGGALSVTAMKTGCEMSLSVDSDCSASRMPDSNMPRK